MQLLLQYEIGRCADCGKPIYFKDYYDVRFDGEKVCTECAYDHYTECDCCGHLVREDNCSRDHYGELVCEDCLSEAYIRCNGCGDFVRKEDSERIGYSDFCPSCADDYCECSDCGEAVRNEDSYTTSSGDTICDSCYEEYYFTCPGCENIFNRDSNDACWSESEDCYYCSECYEEEDKTGVMCYHGFGSSNYKPRFAKGEKPVFDLNGGITRPVTYGVELECDNGIFDYDAFSKWTDDGDLIHFEHDGSLTDKGVECISQPCSLKFHQREMNWEEILSTFITQGFKSHQTENCGLHIHIGRSGISPVTISKMDIFINRAFYHFFSKIGRRDRIYLGSCDSYKAISAKKGKLGYCDDDRYQAINTQNDRTVEIRIFKGTLKHETLIGTIEMVDALIRFLNNLPLGDIYETKKNILNFVDFCGNSQGEYPHLMPMMIRLVNEGVAVPNLQNWKMKIESKNQRKENAQCA